METIRVICVVNQGKSASPAVDPAVLDATAKRPVVGVRPGQGQVVDGQHVDVAAS